MGVVNEIFKGLLVSLFFAVVLWSEMLQNRHSVKCKCVQKLSALNRYILMQEIENKGAIVQIPAHT